MPPYKQRRIQKGSRGGGAIDGRPFNLTIFYPNHNSNSTYYTVGQKLTTLKVCSSHIVRHSKFRMFKTFSSLSLVKLDFCMSLHLNSLCISLQQYQLLLFFWFSTVSLNLWKKYLNLVICKKSVSLLVKTEHFENTELLPAVSLYTLVNKLFKMVRFLAHPVVVLIVIGRPSLCDTRLDAPPPCVRSTARGHSYTVHIRWCTT